MTATEAFERVRPNLASAGVTRVAEITGLDRIGIPTFISVRPAARTLAVDSGKGATVEAARASAAYESIERHVAETADVPYVMLTLEELEAYENFTTDVPRVRGSVLRTGVKYPFAWTQDMLDGGRPVLAPLAAVRLLAGSDLTLGQWVWASTSNGLAAGTSFEEAAFQGLCEVIERDACACHQWAGYALAQEDADASNAWMAARCLDVNCWPGKHDMEGIAGLLVKIRAAGCEVRCFDFSMEDTRLPVVQCFLYDPRAPEEGLFKGYGCHPDPRIALRRAITEAVQARCVIVAGARDDIDSVTHAQTRGESVAAIVRALHEMRPAREKTVPRMRVKAETHLEVADHLCDAGFPSVLVHDFGEHHGAHVVRVIVPGLAGYWRAGGAVCERMKNFAAEAAKVE